MKVVWLCNICLPAIAQRLGIPYSNREGWLSGVYDRLVIQAKNGNCPIDELAILFPVDSKEAEVKLDLEVKGFVAYGFYENLSSPENYYPELEESFGKILEEFKPDKIHIFGTEFPHCLAMTRSCKDRDKIYIGIQGVCSEIAKVYMAGLPENIYKKKTLRDVLRKDSLVNQQEKFEMRAEHEREALSGAGHVLGRTDFDKKTARRLCPEAQYHFVQETLRPCFYEGSWDSSNTSKHRIFVSQGDYPLKGFHYVLMAAAKLKETFADIEIAVAGNQIINKDFVHISAYGKYCRKLIKNLGLTENINLLGNLSAEEMKKEMLESSVFVCASVLENSPNSLGEAMLLGLPCIATNTGGIPSILTDSLEGYLVPVGDTQALADKLAKFLSDPILSNALGAQAHKRALWQYDSEKNFKDLMEAYS